MMGPVNSSGAITVALTVGSRTSTTFPMKDEGSGKSAGLSISFSDPSLLITEGGYKPLSGLSWRDWKELTFDRDEGSSDDDL